jgi:hypothetical protein
MEYERKNRTPRSVVSASLSLNDFGAKKARAMLTLRQVDEQRSGIVKASVFMNLLNCMDITLDEIALNGIESSCCFSRNSVMYIKFENALKIIKYDNSTEQWTLIDEKRGEIKAHNAHSLMNSTEIHKDTASVVSKLTQGNL